MAQALSLPNAWWPALVVAMALLIAALIVSLAINRHAETINRLAGDLIFHDAAQIPITHGAWQRLIEQIAADVLHQPLRVMSCSSVVIGKTSCIRFVLHDGCMLVFSTDASWLHRLRLLDPQVMPRQCGQLHAVCRYFAQKSECAGAIPRSARWRVQVLRTQPAQVHPVVERIFRSNME